MVFNEIFSIHALSFLAALLLISVLAGILVKKVAHVLPLMLIADWKAQAREIIDLPEEEGAQANPKRLLDRAPLVETVCVVLSAIVALKFGWSWQCATLLILTWGLIALSVIDWRHKLLPDDLVLPLLWLGLGVNYFELFTSLENAFLGAAGGYLSLWVVSGLFKLIRRKEGMGHGDFKLLAMIGAWGGWEILSYTVLMSSVIGVSAGVLFWRLRKTTFDSQIPFGPYLAISGWIMMIVGNGI